MDLICFNCLTDPDAMPGTTDAPAVTVIRGTALCGKCARDFRNEMEAGARDGTFG